MVITGRFVYLHIPKTGGTFVEEALARVYAAGAEEYIDTANPPYRGSFGCPDQHERHCHVPAQYRDRPLLLSVRNPFDHHVSLYEFGWWKTHPGDTFDPARIVAAYPHFPDLSFAEYLAAVNDWDLNEPGYAPKGGYELLRASGLGPISFDFIRFLAPDPDAVFARLPEVFPHGDWRGLLPSASFLPTHRLNQSLHEFLLGQGNSPAQVDFILTLDKVLPGRSTRTEAMRWQDYYDEASRRLVRERERLLFELFPEFDTPASAA